MDYSTEALPPFCLEHCNAPGNFATKNKRFRTAVCQYLQLEWQSIAGNGNCLFESVFVSLRAAGMCPSQLVCARQLRLDVVAYFHVCIGSTQDLCERVVTEIQAELSESLVCSTHAGINGRRVNGYVPSTITDYLEARANDGVWAQGWHWLRAVSFLYDVRIGVVIFGHEVCVCECTLIATSFTISRLFGSSVPAK